MITWNTIANAPLQPLIQRLGWTLVHSTWEGLAIAALLLIALRLLRNATATKRYAACGLALLATVCAIVVTFTLCADPAPAPTARVSPIPIASLENLSAFPPLSIAPTISAPKPARQTIILQTIVLVWILGALLMTIRHVGGWLWLRRLRQGTSLECFEPALRRIAARLGIHRIVRLLETTRLDVPAVIGFLRPVILIPVGILNDLSPQQVEAILAHELAHIRRYDCLVNLLQVALETLLFYHPAIWWMSNRMRAEREHCCDDIAADLCGDKCLYAAALTARRRTHRRRSARPRPQASQTPAHCSSRLRSPADDRRHRAPLCRDSHPLFRIHRNARQNHKSSRRGAASSSYNDINILIGQQSMSVNGKRVDWTQLEGMLVALPQPQRSKTVLALATNSGNVTVDRYFEASNHLTGLVKKYGLAYVSQTGIKPTTDPSADLPPGTEVGEYYMTGHVRRGGIYSLTGRKITLRQALVAAGGVEPGFENAEVSILRREGDRESIALDVASVNDLMNGRNPADYNSAFFLKPNDLIAVAVPHSTTSTTQSAILTPPSDPRQPGEYYIDGEVPRTGVYTTTGRKITLKQALAASGGLKQDATSLVITVIRRIGDKESYPLDRLPADDLMQGRRADIYLWPNDIVRITIKPLTTIEEIAAVDPTMREYIKTRDTLQFRVDQLRRNLGDNARVVQDAKADVDLQKQRIEQYAAEYRKHSGNIHSNGATAIPATGETESQLKTRQNSAASQPATAPSVPSTQAAGRTVGVNPSLVLAQEQQIELGLIKAARNAAEGRDRMFAATLGSEHPVRQALHARIEQLNEEIAKLSQAATVIPATQAAISLPIDLVVLLRQRAALKVAMADLTNAGSDNAIRLNYQNALDRINKRITGFTTPSTSPAS